MVILATMVIVILFGALAVQNEISGRQKQAINNLALQSEKYLLETEHLLRAVAISIPEISSERQVALLAQVRAHFPRFSSVFLLDETGRVNVEDTDTISLLGLDMSGEPYYKHARESSDVYFSDPFISLGSHLVSITAALPIYENGELQGMVVADLNLTLLQDSIEKIYAGEEAVSFIVDNRGTLIVHPNQQWVQEQRNLGDFPIIKAGLSGIEQSDQYYDNHLGMRVIGSVKPMTNSWTVVTIQPTQTANSPIHMMVIVSGAAFSISMVVFFSMQHASVRKITAPISTLAERAATLARSPYEPMGVEQMGSFKEIYTLSQSFEQMAAEIHERDRYLEEQVATRTSEVQEKARELETANQNLLQKTLDLALINDVNSSILRGDNLNEVITEFTDKTRAMYPDSSNSGAAVFLLNEAGRQLVMQNIPLSQERYEKIERLFGKDLPVIHIPLTDENLHQQVMQARKPRLFSQKDEIDQWFRDFINETWIKQPWFLKQARKLAPQVSKIIGLQSLMSIPLYVGTEPIGLMDITSETPFTTEDLRRNELVANQLAVALQRTLDNEEIRALKEFNEGIVQTVPGAIVVNDLAGIYTFVNPAAVNLLGYQPEELIGEHWEMIFPPDQRELVYAADERRSLGVADSYEVDLQHKNGTRIPVLISGSPRQDTHSGEFLGTLAVITDISERVRAEAALKQNAIELERSNQDLERFAYISSHDLQEPLRKIQAFGDRLRSKYGEKLDERGSDYLLRMQEAARRGQEMVEDLLVYSRVSTRGGDFEAVDLNQVANEVLEELKTNIELTAAQVSVSELPTIQAAPAQMRQLLQHLIGNAIKFQRPEATPLIRVYAEEKDQDHITLAVSDNGIGFEAQYLEKMFQPFQRLHGRQVYPGSGIGLAICRKIVERHGGAITAASIPGNGSTFSITIPFRNGSNHKE